MVGVELLPGMLAMAMAIDDKPQYLVAVTLSWLPKPNIHFNEVTAIGRYSKRAKLCTTIALQVIFGGQEHSIG